MYERAEEPAATKNAEIRFTEHLLMGIHGCLVTATTKSSNILRFINQKVLSKEVSQVHGKNCDRPPFAIFTGWDVG